MVGRMLTHPPFDIGECGRWDCTFSLECGMADSELYVRLKRAVAEIDENGISAFGLSNAYLYALAKVAPGSVPTQYRQESEAIRTAYAMGDPSAEIDDSLAVNSMLMLDEAGLQEVAGRIMALYDKVAQAEGHPMTC